MATVRLSSSMILNLNGQKNKIRNNYKTLLQRDLCAPFSGVWLTFWPLVFVRGTADRGEAPLMAAPTQSSELLTLSSWGLITCGLCLCSWSFWSGNKMIQDMSVLFKVTTWHIKNPFPIVFYILNTILFHFYLRLCKNWHIKTASIFLF